MVVYNHLVNLVQLVLMNCYARAVTDNLKLLVVISDGTSSTFVNNAVLKWPYDILPVVQFQQQVTIPSPLNIPQAARWRTDIRRSNSDAIFGLIGISDEDQRIFISYKRSDTTALAGQLFDRLNHEGFEVFLDQFSIRPSVNFQNRLYQELADKAMVIFLESPDFLSSSWVQLEIGFAKKYQLGLLALNVNNSPKIPSIDNEYRTNISLQPSTGLLNIHDLDDVSTTIKQHHSLALYTKRNYLTSNIIAALKNNGATTSIDNNGFINVVNKVGNLNYKIWATPRPPKVNDYHYADITHASGEKIIVGPEFRELKRETLNKWLMQKSSVTFFNEGQILDLTNLIYP